MAEALAIVQAFWATLYERDWDGIKTFFDDDSVYYDVPTGGLSAARGPERIEARLRLGIEPLSEYKHHLRAMAAHDDIVEAAAIGVADDHYGQRLRAFVVLRKGASLKEQEVKDYVKANLARYKVPRDVHFLDQLPRNPSGKVLKRELAQLDAEG